MQKVKDYSTRRWYMEQTLANGWSRNVLALQIDARAHARRGKAASNLAARLPAPQSDLTQQTLKDPYIFDFLTLTEPFQERELETELVRHLEAFPAWLVAAHAGRSHQEPAPPQPPGSPPILRSPHSAAHRGRALSPLVACIEWARWAAMRPPLGRKRTIYAMGPQRRAEQEDGHSNIKRFSSGLSA